MSVREYKVLVNVETDTLPTGGTIESSSYVAKNADYVITDTDNYGTIALTGSVSKTFTLPTAADNTNRKITFLNLSTATLTIDGEGAETINGEASIELKNKHEATTLQCNGAAWYKVGNYGSTYVVKPKTTDYAIQAEEVLNNSIFTNAGASGKVIFTLPSVSTGYCVYFIVTDANELQISAASGDYIYLQNSNKLEAISNSSKGKVLVLFGVDSTNWFAITADSWSDTGARGLFGGGYTGSYLNVIDYITVSTTGNATDFGDLSVARSHGASAASSTRALWQAGDTGSNSDVIDYVTIATTGNATDFGNVTEARSSGACGFSNETRALCCGGYTTGYANVMDYITIATTGNSSDFGDIASGGRSLIAGCSNTTRGILCGGTDGSVQNYIDYVTIASAGNSSDFGDTINQRSGRAGCSSSTRGVFLGAGNSGSFYNNIEYITIASTGNSSDFGDLATPKDTAAACSSKLRGCCAGGNTGSVTNAIEYVTIASTGNATSFGNLTVSRSQVQGTSNAHGGLV